MSAGSYVADFEKTGYQTKSRAVNVRSTPIPLSERLMPQYAAGAFPADVVAKAYLTYSKGPEGKPQDFTREWDLLRGYRIAPSDRLVLAQKVVNQYESVVEKFPDIKQYTQLSKEAVPSMSAAFRHAIKTEGAAIPPRESAQELKIGDQVVADIVIYEVLASDISPKRKDEFLKAFAAKWEEKTPAVQKVIGAYAPERMRLINPP